MTSWNIFPLTWLITGASSGFGLELTRLALRNGHKVIATSRNPQKVPELVSEVEDAGGRWLTLDVDDPEGGSVVEKLENEGVQIDILVNNAGWSIHGPAESFSEDEVRRQMETVYFGPYRLIRAALPHMRERRRGLILNIGSGAGVKGRESMGIYAGSKAAMDGSLTSVCPPWQCIADEERSYEDPHTRSCTIQYPYSDGATWWIRHEFHICTADLVGTFPSRLYRQRHREDGGKPPGKQFQARWGSPQSGQGHL